jgi:hypothetical protein
MEVGVVVALVEGGRQLHHLVFDSLPYGVRRLPPPVAVGQARRALLPECRLEPKQVTS